MFGCIKDRLGRRGACHRGPHGATANNVEIAHLRIARESRAHNAGGRQLAFVSPSTHCIERDIFWVNMAEICASEIGNGQLAEHIVQDGGRILDAIIALHHASWFEARESESFHVFFKRHAILQPERDGDGEIVHQ